MGELILGDTEKDVCVMEILPSGRLLETNIKTNKKGKYELQFEALPAHCHIFDIIEDFYDTSTRYYGVRQAGNAFTVSNPKEHNHGNNKAQRISAIWGKVL